MVQKRQLAEEEYVVSPKHMKLESGCQLVSCLEFPSKDVPLQPYTLGKAEDYLSKQLSESDSGFESGKNTSSWSSSMTSEEDMRQEAPVLTPQHSPFKPRTLIQVENTYSYLLSRPPVKQIPIGSEHEAVIPEWCGRDANNTAPNLPQSSKYIEEENKFIGTCVIPMPEDTQAICDKDPVRKGRTECSCEDLGSVKCVQQHIKEAREKLKAEIGHERFSELGYDDMGDVVSQNWTEADEQLFHEVVYSNPASLGKNFWHRLATVFPSRTNREIVSFYFNVFVLRRRADQNRCDPMNIDSDDDEWQGSDEEEDSCRDEILEYDSRRPRTENPVLDYFENIGLFHGFNGSPIFSETQPRKSFDSSSLDSSKTPADESRGCYSCTSSGNLEPRGNHEFMFEPSYSKVWDVGCFSFSKNESDFLPTGSMIEEVFGAGSWNMNEKPSS